MVHRVNVISRKHTTFITEPLPGSVIKLLEKLNHFRNATNGVSAGNTP